MKQSIKDCIIYGASAAVIVVSIAISVGMATLNRGDDTEARIEHLEQQMLEKTRPVINVESATIYNTDGEIVLETHDGR